jgi:lipopolysaccharide export system protein LptA
MTRLKILTAASVCAAVLLIGAANAQPVASNGPLDVTGDALEVIDAQHLAIWRGNVEAVQDGNRLVADTMNVYFQGSSASSAAAKPKTVSPASGGAASVGQSWGSAKQVVADGHVFFVSTTQTARGTHAVYEVEPDTVTMTGDVVMVQGDNVIKGDKVVIQVKTGHADVISNVSGRNKPERVRGVFYNANQTPPAAAPAKP